MAPVSAVIVTCSIIVLAGWIILLLRRIGGLERTLAAKPDVDKVEAVLLETRSQLEATFERMTDNIVSLDLDWRYTWCNGRALANLRKTREELIGRSLWEVFPMILGTEFELRYREAMRSQQADEFESEFKPYGIWVHVRVYPAPSGLTLFYRDITIEKQTRHRLDEQQAFLQRLIETVPLPICHKDASGLIRGCNPAFLAFQGIGAEQIIGLCAPITFPPDMLEQVRKQDSGLLANGGRAEFPMTVRIGDGSEREVLVVKAAYMHPDGSVAGLLTFIVDLTERVRSERVLRMALDQAQAANVAKSQFLATMSHEIRTPLNGVIGMTDVLLQSGLNEAQAAMAEIVRDSGGSLLAVIGDVLDLAKIESGTIHVERTDFSMRRMARELQVLFAASARAKSLDLSVQVAADLPESLLGDAGRLRQVLMNLLGNAVKFTDRGGVSMTVGLHGPDQDGLQLACEVSDTGPGIPADYLPHIFEPFSQADATSSRRHGGTGLGLAIAKRLTDLMGGTLAVETMLGLGSRFRLVVPLSRGDPDLPGRVDPGAGAPSWRGTPRILVVEDDPVCQVTIQAMLKGLGCRHHLAVDGDMAIQLVARERFDLVLMDCQMPGSDGFTATRAIRRCEDGGMPRTPIIALSANVFVEDRERCLEAGMDDFLPKPCTMDALRDCLIRWMALQT